MKLEQRKSESLLINKNFQLKMIGLFLMISLLTALSYARATYLFFESFNALGKDVGLSSDSYFYKFLDKQQQYLLIAFISTFLVSTILIIIFGLKFSHKVAGPFHRLHLYLKNYKEGTTNKLSFREGDFFQEIEQELNLFLEEKEDTKEAS